MIRPRRASTLREARKPRACGDDPEFKGRFSVKKEVNPAHAGMIPRPSTRDSRILGKPRACGDDPSVGEEVDTFLS